MIIIIIRNEFLAPSVNLMTFGITNYARITTTQGAIA